MVSLNLLRKHALFGCVKDDDLKKIRELFKVEQFSKGKNIIQEGEPGDRLYFIHNGSVEILKDVSSSQGSVKERIAVLKKGDTFGEMELIDIQPRVATVRTLKKTKTLSLSNKDLYAISLWDMETFSIIIMNLAREISRRLRKMDALVASSLFAKGKKERN